MSFEDFDNDGLVVLVLVGVEPWRLAVDIEAESDGDVVGRVDDGGAVDRSDLNGGGGVEDLQRLADQALPYYERLAALRLR